MQKTRDNIKILLLQFRLAKEMREQEMRCYLKFSKLNPGQIISSYILEEEFDMNLLGDYDAIFIGGTGDFGVYEVEEKFPRAFRQLKEIANYARSNKMPVLSVCMQFWAMLFGGEVKTDESRQEVGTFTIFLTKEAKDDPLFFDMPDNFKAQVGHKDYASKLPEGSTLLAYSNLCPTHAYKTGEKEYAMQFHPELDKEAIIERMDHYRSYTASDPEEYQKQIDALEDTPDSTTLLDKFIDRIILK